MSVPTKAGDYKDSVCLPKTDFPMKAGLDKLEPRLQEHWKKIDITARIREARAGAPRFVLHDGPPYATGDLHVGTGLNKALKDFIVRYRTMRGFDSPYRPGWDCHGLPIESKVMKELGPAVKTTPTPELRRRCLEYAMKYFARNRDEFKRLGIFGEWDRPYLTVDPVYEAGILDVFADMVDKGGVYRALRPIHWCIYDETALAEAELEYGVEVSPSVTVRFPLVDSVADLYPDIEKEWAEIQTDLKSTNPYTSERAKLRLDQRGGRSVQVDLLIWTTTPWTLPANMAIAVHPELDYALVEYDHLTKRRYAIVADALADTVFQGATYLPRGQTSVARDNTGYAYTGTNEKKNGLYRKLGAVKGKQLEGLHYSHPFLQHEPSSAPGHRKWSVVLADYVTVGGEGRKADEDLVADENVDKSGGTGLVHTAPGHGREDYLTGKKYGLEIACPVDSQGRLTPAAGVFVGERVFDADPKIVELLRERGVLFHHDPYRHSYPHCWRCKKPVIFRATEQWFVNVDANNLRGRMLDTIKNDVKWFPEYGAGRIGSMVQRRPDWCISRQRHWGVPIPAFFNRKTGEGLVRADVVRHVRDLFAKHGSGCWFERSVAELLPTGFTHEGFTAADFEKELAIFDVWFESGASHRSVLRDDKDPDGSRHLEFPAAVYLEGSDQHRGWFQVSLITAMAADGTAPFKNVVTHGFVVDANGQKMSKSNDKSKDNYISLGDALKTAGADLFRLWVSSVDYSKDINTSHELMKRVHDPYRQYRNTLRILLGNLHGFDPARDRVPAGKMTEIDRWAMSRLHGLIRDCRDAYDRYAFFKVFSAVNEFCSNLISAFWIDVLKDRMYCEAPAGDLRRSSQTAMYDILSALTRIMAPVLVHTAEEGWEFLRKLGASDLPTSVHLALFPEPDEKLIDRALDARWDRLLKLRADVNRELDKLRKAEVIGKSLEAEIELHTQDAETAELLRSSGAELLSTILMSSTVSVVEAAGEGFAPTGDTPKTFVRVSRGRHPKCGRCWNLRSDVGSSATHPTLCKRCADVVS